MNEYFPIWHPFPYFSGLKVTRDTQLIASKIREKYDIEKKFKDHITQGHRFKDFNKYVLLIADQGGLGTGNFNPSPDKIEKIVQACLKELDGLLDSMVHPVGNTIHPGQLKLLISSARDRFWIDERLAEDHLREQLRLKRITLDERAPPPPPIPPPQPVTNLRAELQDRGLRLSWDKPADRCDCVVIRRGDWPANRRENAPGNRWEDQGLQPGKQYVYEVSSVYAGGTPGGTNSLNIVAWGLINTLTATPDGDQIKLQWQTLPGVQGQVLYRSDQPIALRGDEKGNVQVNPIDRSFPLDAKATTWNDVQVERGRTYFYALVLQHAGSVCSHSTCVSATVTADPTVPTADQVRVTTYPGRIFLAWPATIGPGGQYRLERRDSPDFNRRDAAARPPTCLKNSTFEDAAIEPGTCYWYGLSTEHNGVISRQRTIVGPILATAEVAQLRAEVRSRQIILSWDPPPGLKRVEVLRSDKAVPMGPGQDNSTGPQGILIAQTTPQSAIDSELTNDVTYYYRVCCVFAYPDGREVVTMGECVKATPCDVPKSVTNIQLTGHRDLILQWDNPNKATVLVHRSAAPLAPSPGTVISLLQLPDLGVPLTQSQENCVVDHRPSLGEPYYHVFSTNKHRANYCGYARWIELKQVNVRVDRTHVTVEWTWPSGCDAIELLHTAPPRKSLPPGGDTPLPSSRIIRKNQGLTSSVFVNCDSGEHRFHIRCLPPHDEPHIASGPGWTRRVQVGIASGIRWQLLRHRFPQRLWRGRRAFALRLLPNGILPPIHLRLIAAANRIPHDISDGETLAEWDSADTQQGASVDLPLRPWNRGPSREILCTLIAEPESLITVIPPESRQQRRL